MATQSKMATRISGEYRQPRAATAFSLILTHPSSSHLRYAVDGATDAADSSHQSLISYSRRLLEVLSPPAKRQTNPASRRIAPFSGMKRIKSSSPPPTVTTAAAVSEEIAAAAASQILPPP
ncbi:hypothetical protein AXF42_Ash015741 [Apostasia shenzhenica]|uniref:Uncharacterized protein n=1 Tax=Apostasia shenzhenica TaxID=1088818 RepID=A0A2H9ZU82_9ASPA|nr:hypothetical protein AXF42_Ash015741 [Apostasia shenzhenica]